MRWTNLKVFLLFLVLLLLSLPLFSQANGPQSFTGKVVGVSDGDTISVMRKGWAVEVRLHGIDCPEIGQPYGERAKRYTSDLTFGKEVEVQVHGTDRYGRTLGEVVLPGGINFNHELVAAGPSVVCGRMRIQYRLGNGGKRNMVTLRDEKAFKYMEDSAFTRRWRGRIRGVVGGQKPHPAVGMVER